MKLSLQLIKAGSRFRETKILFSYLFLLLAKNSWLVVCDVVDVDVDVECLKLLLGDCAC